MTDFGPVWALLDDRAGNRSQVLGVANALGVPIAEKDLEYGPIAKLPNMVLGASIAGLTANTKTALCEPWPELVISAGRRTAPVARWIKSRSPGARLVQIMDPGAGAQEFDLICVPAHDEPAPASNKLLIPAAPHGMTEQRLNAAAREWSPKLEEYAPPRIAVMIGGSTRRRTFTDPMARDLATQIRTEAGRLGASVLATTSRRTGNAVDVIAGILGDRAMLHRWDSGAENPYVGFLALADAIVVTGESVSMCSEACATGKPVYIYVPDGLITPKHARLHAALFEGGHAKPFDGEVDLKWVPERLSVAADIVAEIRARGLLPKGA